jgi:hypothetical protein
MVKSIAVIALVASVYAGEAEMIDYTTGAVAEVQAQQAAALSQIQAVRLRIPPPQ